MSIATLIYLDGQAWARAPDGQLRELRIGDVLQPGEFLVTGTNSRAVLDVIDSPATLEVGGGRVVEMAPEVLETVAGAEGDSPRDDAELDALLAALEEPEADLLAILDPAAAGPGAGGEQGGHDFVRLPRIVENVDPLSYDFDQAGGRELPEARDAAPAASASPAEAAPAVPADPDAPADPEDPAEPDDPSEPEDPAEPDDPSEPEDPTEPDDPSEPEDPEDPEDPAPVTYLTHAHTVGASNAGTMANANALKETNHNSANVYRSDAGFYAVDHRAASDDPAAIEPGEALLFELAAAADTATFELTGSIAGGTYHLYDDTGLRIFEGSLEELDMQDGLVTIDHEDAFSYVAFLGGSSGPGSSGDESAFAVRPVALVPEVDTEAEVTSLQEPDADTLDWGLADEEPAFAAEQESTSLYRLGDEGALDLRDLLSEWNGDSDSLDDFLQASASADGDTLLHVSAEGGFGDGDLEVADQVFLLEGVAYHDNILQQLLEDEELDIE